MYWKGYSRFRYGIEIDYVTKVKKTAIAIALGYRPEPSPTQRHMAILAHRTVRFPIPDRVFARSKVGVA